jgi:hypothetical protein
VSESQSLRGWRRPDMPVDLNIPRITRDPCLRCGARGELGCEHGTVRRLTVMVG